MGASKTFVFTKRQNRAAVLMKALGHPARVAIIDYLIKKNQATADDIVNELPLSQPTISQHLRELKNSRLIKGVFKGSRLYYYMNEVVFSEIEYYHDEIIEKIEKRKQRIGKMK
ncbi:MAG TPA: metalloregulator ArsR/SmtB family transcription factor [Flavobacteriaceae bacterium]|nr:metalloregulator ArsR/SmtB family transcription factor [Flavobacteriaceae bacterium]